MKNLFIIIAVVLVLALIGETAFLFKQISIQQKLSLQQTGLEQKITDLGKEKASLEQDKSQLQVETGKLSQENKSLTEQVTKMEGEAKAATENILSLTKSLADQKNNVSKLTNENSALNRKYLCSNPLTKVDFSSNDKVSEILTSYVRGVKNSSEPVSAHYWNLVWSDSKYSIHTVEVNSEKDHVTYVWKFTAYFNGEAHGRQVNGIFYNDMQCWLYLDK